MSVSITAFTDNNPFIMRGKTRTYMNIEDELGELCVLDIRVGDLDLKVYFQTAQELIAFCQKRNISCADARSRTGVEKYLQAKRGEV